MPLIEGSSPKTVSKNISEFHTGKTYAHTKEKFGAERANAQAIAVALSTARKSRAMGGPMSMGTQVPWFVKQEARNMTHTGPINSAVPGRTDAHSMNVPSGAYVIPSHAVSHLGQNNTMAGFGVLSKMFPNSTQASGPYGAGLPSIARGHPNMGGNIKMPKMKMVSGGSDVGGARGHDGVGVPTPVATAGGEFIVHPSDLINRWGSLKRAHAQMDDWMNAIQKEHTATIKKLPGPAKD